MFSISNALGKSKVLNSATVPVADAVSSALSQAKQANEVAVANLQAVLCMVLDGPDCQCGGNSLKVSEQ